MNVIELAEKSKFVHDPELPFYYAHKSDLKRFAEHIIEELAKRCETQKITTGHEIAAFIKNTVVL
jgi:hypothetical protein